MQRLSIRLLVNAGFTFSASEMRSIFRTFAPNYKSPHNLSHD